MKAFQLAGFGWRGFVIAHAVVTTGLFGRLVYRESRNPLLSFVVYTAVFYSFVSFTAMRQGLAISIVLFLGYGFVRERNLPAFLTATFVAFLMHKSALFALPLYFLPHTCFGRRELLMLTLGCASLALFGGQVISIFDSILKFGSRANTGKFISVYTISSTLGRLPPCSSGAIRAQGRSP